MGGEGETQLEQDRRIVRDPGFVAGGVTSAYLERLQTRTFGKISPYEDEWAKIQVAKEGDEPIPVGGPILVRELSVERLLVVADALAKSVVLAHDERQVANVFDTIEPFARELGREGTPLRR